MSVVRPWQWFPSRSGLAGNHCHWHTDIIASFPSPITSFSPLHTEKHRRRKQLRESRDKATDIIQMMGGSPSVPREAVSVGSRALLAGFSARGAWLKHPGKLPLHLHTVGGAYLQTPPTHLKRVVAIVTIIIFLLTVKSHFLMLFLLWPFEHQFSDQKMKNHSNDCTQKDTKKYIKEGVCENDIL